MSHSLLFDLVIFCGTAILFVPIFRKLKLSPILAYLFGGILIGPQVVGLIGDQKVILHFSELGVVFLLFMIGLELSPGRLWKLRHSIFGFGFLQVFISGLSFFLISRWLGFSLNISFVIGTSLALSSTAFSVQLLKSYRQLQSPHGQASFSILMFQDLAVIPILAILAILEGKEQGAMSLISLLKMGGVFILLYILGRYAIRHIFRMIADPKAQEVFTAASLLVVLGTAILFESVGFTMGLGAFVAGVLLANSEYRHELESNLQPFKGLLLGLFFMAVGMSLDFAPILEKPLILVGLTLGFMSLKGLLIFFLARLFRYSTVQARAIACILPQGGEFAFVIFSTATTGGIIGSELSSLLAASVTLSMLFSPFLFNFQMAYSRKSASVAPEDYDKIESNEPKIIVAGFGRFGQIVSRFLNAEKIPYSILEGNAQQVETARRYGNRVFYGDATRFDILEAAGCREATHFIICVDTVDAALSIARVVREKYPNLNIIARARNREHAIKLMEMGIKDIIRDTYFSSLEAAKLVLRRMDRSPEAIDRKIEKFIHYDSKLLLKQFDLRHDQKGFISHTAKANEELENILAADQMTLEETSETKENQKN